VTRSIARISAAVGLSLAVLLLLAWFVAGKAVEVRAPAPHNEELVRLREDVDRLKKRPITREVVHLEEEGSVPRSETPASAPPDQRAMKERALLQERKTLRDLEARFRAERADDDWSERTTRQIHDAIARTTPGAEVAEASCASSLCRVVVKHEDATTQAKLGSELVLVEPFRAGVLYDYDRASSPPKTTIFVMREGYGFEGQVLQPVN
jgi:hypothetical protein